MSGPSADDARLALGRFAGQFVLNLAWSAVSFGARSILGGLVVVVLLWIAVLATVVAFYRVDVRAAALLVPYLLRVSFAGFPNYASWVLN